MPKFYETPERVHRPRIKANAPNGDIDALIEQTVSKAPAVESRRRRVEQAEQDLALAQLNLSYCKIFADIDGFVSNRNVNPGDRVAQGQRLMAIRSSEEVWIDCNFKETQIEPIRIGHPVDIHVDAYPDKVFQGPGHRLQPRDRLLHWPCSPPRTPPATSSRSSRGSPSGSSWSARNPKDTPLFVGLSCVPHIKVNEQPEGPNAGQRLRGNFPKVGEESRKSK